MPVAGFRRTCLAAIFAIAAVVLPATAVAQDDPVLVGRVIEVVDGDTVKVRLASGPINVRF